MPFISGPPEPTPDRIGTCTVCGSKGRVWKFGEKVVPLGAELGVVLSYAICRACIEVIQVALDEDDDDAGPASDLPA